MKLSTIQQKLELVTQLRGYSKKTTKTYLQQLKQFHKWFKKDIDEATFEDINQYKLYLASKKLKNSSIRSAVESLKFCLGQLLNKKRFLKLKGPKLNKPHRAIFTREEVKAMIDLTQNFKHKLLLMFLYGSGPRVEECVKIKIKNLYVKGNQCFISSGKGNKDRCTLIGNKFIQAYKQYISIRKEINPYLFNRGKTHITIRTAQEVVKQAKKRCKINKPGLCHALRRSFATHLAQQGINVKDLQKMLGHANLKTTLGYIESSPDFKNIKSPLDVL